MFLNSDRRRSATVLFALLVVLLAAGTISTLVSSDYNNEGHTDNLEPLLNLVPEGGTGSFLGVQFRYVQSPPVTCSQSTMGTVVILGFNNSRWQTCICDGQGASTYNWEDFFDGGYCAWEGPV